MTSTCVPALALFFVGACGGVSRNAGFDDDGGPSAGDDAAALTGLHGGVGSACGAHGEVHVTCAEGLACVMNVCEQLPTADAGGAVYPGSDASAGADAKPASEDGGPATAAHPRLATLAVSGDHACVLRGGKVECWGSNQGGELGIGTSSGPQSCDNGVACSPVPLAVTGLNAPVDSVAAGDGETCVLFAGGTVACWGANDSGQLGNGSTSGPEQCPSVGTFPCSTTPVVVPGVSGAVAVATSGSEACVVLSNGAVECWGSNFDGKLGNETVAAGNPGGTSSVPLRVTGLTGATAVAVGQMHACALLLDGTVRCWGSNSAGQLGNGSTADSSAPVPVSGVTGAVAIAAGASHSCALMADETVTCWGDNGDGALGLGTSSGPETCGNMEPCSTTAVKVPDLTGVTAIGAGAWSTCALLSDGTARCWGWNYQGELGGGTMVGDSPTPLVVSGLSAASAIAVGDEGACALASSGDVLCWGQDELDQLGSASTGPGPCANSGYICSTTPVKITGL